MEDCVFCRIASHEIAAGIMYEDENVVAFQDLNPVAPLHILVVPKKHIPGVLSLSEEDAGLVGSIVLAIRKLAQERSIAEDGFRIVINQGTGAGQSVPHLHFHLLGGRRMDWPPG